MIISSVEPGAKNEACGCSTPPYAFSRFAFSSRPRATLRSHPTHANNDAATQPNGAARGFQFDITMLRDAHVVRRRRRSDKKIELNMNLIVSERPFWRVVFSVIVIIFNALFSH
jgi:hypothetical protein